MKHRINRNTYQYIFELSKNPLNTDDDRTFEIENRIRGLLFHTFDIDTEIMNRQYKHL